jgi:hypothetical protein
MHALECAQVPPNPTFDRNARDRQGRGKAVRMCHCAVAAALPSDPSTKKYYIRTSHAPCYGQRYTGNLTSLVGEQKRGCFGNRHRTYPPGEIGIGHTRSVARRIKNTG